MRAEIEALVARCAGDERLRGAKLAVEFKGFMADGCLFPAEQPISRLLSVQHQTVTGEPLRTYAATGLTDARHYALAGGTQAACYGPDAQNIHGIDESVGLDAVRDTTKVLALLIAEWCGLERHPSR